MKSISEYFIIKNKGPLKVGILLALITIIILSILFVYSSELLEEGRSETAMAQAYYPDTREALFDLVIDNHKVEYAEALTNELNTMLISMKYRLYLRSKDMNNGWSKLFKEKKRNITKILTSDFFLKQTTSIFTYLKQYDELTPAEEEILNEIKTVWSNSDNYNLKQKLYHVFAVEMSRNFGYSDGELIAPTFSNVVIYRPYADDLAEHAFNLLTELCEVPRTLNSIVEEPITKVSLTSPSVKNQESEDINDINKLLYIFREYNLKQFNQIINSESNFDIKLYDNNNYRFNPVVIRVYDDAITLRGVHSTYSDKINLMLKHPEIWDSWGFRTEINGTYHVDPQMIHKLQEWADNLVPTLIYQPVNS